MMTANIETSGIIDQAFLFMELAEISSFADRSPQAMMAERVYPRALKACLELHDWWFARRHSFAPQVAELDTGIEPDPDLPYAHKLPGDCLKLRHVYPPAKRWRLDDYYLFSDYDGPLRVRYTRSATDESRFPQGFCDLVSLRMAILLAPRFVSSRTKRADLRQEYRDALRAEKSSNVRSASTESWQDGGALPDDWASVVSQ